MKVFYISKDNLKEVFCKDEQMVIVSCIYQKKKRKFDLNFCLSRRKKIKIKIYTLMIELETFFVFVSITLNFVCFMKIDSGTL